MKILSITAQKPNSTGSGIFLSELVRVLSEQGYEQRVIGGVCRDDVVTFPEGVKFEPVYFNSEKLPFPICGMSDEMPYPSTRYCDMTSDMVQRYIFAFAEVLRRTVNEFKPDLILCHHLYLLTAVVREQVKDIPVYGFCHNTDLRQMKKHGLEQERIKHAIRQLDRIFVLRKDQIEEVVSIYGADPARITAVGMGYNRKLFYPDGKDRGSRDVTHLIYAGKITQKKGVLSLLRSLNLLNEVPGSLDLICAGGAGNEEEYHQITDYSLQCRYPVSFPGRLDQEKLADLYRSSDIFVLPSFYEGIPLTIIEALACGCRVVVSDLPGVREWLEEFTCGADIRYVSLPGLHNTDEPIPEELPAFENRLASAISQSIHDASSAMADVSRISWERIVLMILSEL